MPIFLSRCVKCFLWQYDDKVHNLAVAFKQLNSSLAGKYEVKEVHTVFIKTGIKHAVFTTFACFSIEQKMGNYETKSLD